MKDEDQVVSWWDGDLAQVATIASEESLATHSKNKICANKQNAACSAVEQPADLTKCFKLFHCLQKAMTVEDVPAEQHPLKKLMLATFADLHSKGQLILSLTKRKALVDFVSITPEMSGKGSYPRKHPPRFSSKWCGQHSASLTTTNSWRPVVCFLRKKNASCVSDHFLHSSNTN
jgi:hypothetical protein